MPLSIGIDLGTTNSVASRMRGGRPEVIRNRQNSTLTPSVVSFRDGAYLVGAEAVHFSRYAAQDTIYSVKRLMGLNYNDPKVREVAARVPYAIVPPDGGEDIGARVVIDGRQHTPIDVSTIILRWIKEDCEKQLNMPVEGATITTPAYFLECQRTATKEAGEAAGLRLRPLLEEPVAAALAFGAQTNAAEQRLLVYDLGGGTFDVSIVQIGGDNVQVLKNLGDMWLGGDDFDQVIIERISEAIQDKHRIQVDDPQLRCEIRTLAEKAKRNLSRQQEERICESLRLDHADGPLSFELTITREEFENAIRPMLDHSMEKVEQVLRGANIADKHLTNVILAGGSTKIPLVRQMLNERFGEEKVRADVDPMHCVSLGAALWNERFPLEPDGTVSRGKLSKTGLRTAIDIGIEVYKDSDPHHFYVIVPSDEPYPTAKPIKKGPFYPTSENQRLIRVPVFQGDKLSATKNTCLGIINYSLPRGIPAKTPITVGLNIDMHGTLTVEIEVQGYAPEKWQIDRNQPVASAEDHKEVHSWDELKNIIAVAEHFVSTYRDYFLSDDRDKLEKFIAKAKQVLQDKDHNERSRIIQQLEVCMLGSGTASDLFLATRAKQMADRVVAGKIAQACVALEEAFKQNDRQRVKEISDVLKIAVNRVFHANQSGGSQGPLPGQISPG